MAVRSKQLAAGRFGIASTTVTLYTASSGETVLVKSIAVRNRSTGTRTMDLGITPNGGSSNVWLHDTVAAGDSRYLDVWLVLQPGDQLTSRGFAGDGTDSWFFWVSGAELEGVAD